MNTDSFSLEFVGYCVNIIIPTRNFNRLFPNETKSAGFHYPHTIYNIIKHRRSAHDLELTKEHEKNHTISESFLYSEFYDYINQITERIKTNLKAIAHYDSLLTNGTDEPELQRIKQETIQRTATILPDVVYHYFKEIIASFDSPISHHTLTYFFYFVHSAREIAEQIASLHNENSKHVLEESFDVMVQNFSVFLNTMWDIFLAAQTGNCEEKVQAALILFGPNKFHKATRYLKEEIGEEVYKTVHLLQPFCIPQDEWETLRLFETILQDEDRTPRETLVQEVESQRLLELQKPTFLATLDTSLQKTPDTIKTLLAKRINKIRYERLIRIHLERLAPSQRATALDHLKHISTALNLKENDFPTLAPYYAQHKP